jgi:hypothetical protein
MRKSGLRVSHPRPERDNEDFETMRTPDQLLRTRGRHDGNE